MPSTVCPVCKYKQCREKGKFVARHKVPRQVRRQPQPDPAPRLFRYFPVERVVTQSNLDVLAELGYSRSIAMKVLTDN